MTPTPATASDVTRLIGEVDSIALDRILSVGASADEIAEALLGVEEERGFGEEPHPPSTPRVAEVRALITELSLLEGDIDDDEPYLAHAE
jgi:hypothetical protein